MKRISNRSKIEIWSSYYINNSSNKPRRPEDSTDKVNIIQIEPGSCKDDYMVEVEPKEDTDDKSKNNDLIFATGKLSAMSIIVNRLVEECGNPNRDWYGNKVYLEIQAVLHDIETEFKKEVDDAAEKTVSK